MVFDHGQEAFAQFTGSVSTSAWAQLGISFLLSTWQHFLIFFGGKKRDLDVSNKKESDGKHCVKQVFHVYFKTLYLFFSEEVCHSSAQVGCSWSGSVD